jgi:hypothetical protein
VLRLPQVLALAAHIVLLSWVQGAASQPSAAQHEYRAAWLMLANPEPVSAELTPGTWASLFALRPAGGFRLESPLIEAGKRKARLEAGALLVTLRDNPGILCRLERPQHE